MRFPTAIAASLAACLAAAPAIAQDDFASAKVEAVKIKPGVAVIYGVGGNIGVSYGEDGTILVDDQYAPLTAKIQDAVASLGASPTRFLVNTHWHFDHAGGNENFGKAGALIVAHDNVRVRLVKGGTVANNNTPPASPAALPIVTYDNGVTFHVNGDRIDAIYSGGGHTDGDSVVFWREANVLHTGDLFMNKMGYPFIDIASGGNVEHLLVSLGRLIALCDDDTVIIPGHGTLAGKSDLVAFRRMVQTAVDRVRDLKEQGIDLEAAKARKPLAGLRNGDGFVADDFFVETVWASLSAHEH